MNSSSRSVLVIPRDPVMRLSSSSTGRPSFVSMCFGRAVMYSDKPLAEIAEKIASSSWRQST